jgi:hypothetical protein
MIFFPQTWICVITMFVKFSVFFYILSQNLVFDNRSQHSDVEKKRERERERERKREKEQQSAIQKKTRKNMNAINRRCSKIFLRF